MNALECIADMEDIILAIRHENRVISDMVIQKEDEVEKWKEISKKLYTIIHDVCKIRDMPVWVCDIVEEYEEIIKQ